MLSPNFTLDDRLVGDVHVIAPGGALDLLTGPRFSTGLDEAMHRSTGHVMLDLCDVTFVDATGMHLLVGALRRLTRQGRRLSVACPPGAVRRLFDIAGTAGRFSIYPNRAAALQATGHSAESGRPPATSPLARLQSTW